MLIVIEGLDGAGKSTQVKLLKDYIVSKGLELKYLHFPRYESSLYGELIAKFLRGDFGALEDVHPQLVALLFAEDRRDASAVIKEWLNNGYCVLLDRYVYSNIAYQCSKLKDKKEAKALEEWIFNTEYNVFGIPKPNVNIFLDVPIGFVDKKLKECRSGDDDREYLNGKADIHEADINFQIGVRDIYLQQSISDANFIRIDCSDITGNMLHPAQIFSRIETVVNKVIK
ncbi:MAG: dTMP kinase [Bacteroidales bacterium]